MTDRLVVAPCSLTAARYAVLNYHYSRSMPVGKLVTIGAWEGGRYIGAVVFGRGAALYLGRPYGLDQTQVCELTRVALRDHRAPVTEIVAAALRQLREIAPGIRLVVSFADPAQGHVGTIYQAGGWLYLGKSADDVQVFVAGRWRHRRYLRPTGWGGATKGSALSAERKAALPRRVSVGKHRYVMPLDRAMRRRVRRDALPFPRGQGLDGEPAASHAEGPGSTPGGRSTP